MGLKIPTPKLKSANQLADLDQSLKSLLLAAEQGEWDTINDLSGELLPALEAVRTPAPGGNSLPQYSEQIRRTLTLLQAAIEQCAERKAQITPLINALIPTKDLSETP